MENVISVPNYRGRCAADQTFGLDTTVVVFFLAMDLGRGFGSLGSDDILTVLTIAAFIFLPYFLPFDGVKPHFAGWAIRRVTIAITAVIAGMGLQAMTEIFLMESFKFLPMTLLIIAGIFCAATQIRGMIRVRLAS